MIAAANDRLFVKLCDVLARPDLGTDARYRTNRLRVENKGSLLPVIQEVLAAEPAEVWLERLEAARIPCGPIHDMKSMDSEPHVAALG
ncbi:MAG TPA: CoA transferase, partial [Hyphomicrobiaceae bacterium]|nr:CoA transferase [Hyphomicrobiaceae bacterium]